MRLIDADAMNEELFYKQVGGKDSLITAESAFEMINAQPTAYDPDKVVEQLEELTEEECTLHECGIRSERCKSCIAKKAIEIVKGGSIKIIKNESED